ncbi:MAG: hypothetical protein AB1714_21135 [Acidobacteriota bacterium]
MKGSTVGRIDALHRRDGMWALLVVLLAIIGGVSREAQGRSSQSMAWSYIGPDGGYIDDMAIAASKPTRLYVATGNYHLYRTTDGASSWRRAAQRRLSPQALLVDPLVADILYAIEFGVLWKSIDGGSSRKKVLGDDTTRVECLAIDTETSTTLYAGTDSQGVLKSTDGGRSWSRTGGLTPEERQVLALTVDPVAPAVLYAALRSNLLFKSTNGGATWAGRNLKLPYLAVLSDLCVTAARNDIVYASYFGTLKGGVLKSTDAGTTWSEAGTGLIKADVRHLTIDPTSPQLVYAAGGAFGAFVTRNGGRTWARLKGLPDGFICRIVTDPCVAGTIYAGTRLGVFKSTDAGVSWSLAGTGIRENSVSTLAVDPLRADTIYAGGSYGGLFKTTDRGVSWSTSIGLTSRLTYAAVDPNKPTTVYGSGLWDVGTYKSTDDGVSWTHFSRAFIPLLFDPTCPQTMYGGNDEVYKTTNGGESWRKCSDFGEGWGSIEGIIINPTAPSVLYAANSRSGCVWKSTDGGSAWQCTIGGGAYLYEWTVALDASRPDTLYVCQQSQLPRKLWKSTDGGQSWRAVMAGQSVTCVLVSPTASNIVYAGTANHGVYQSTDAGTTWRAINSGLAGSAAMNVRLLAVSEAAPRAVYAATDAGVFRLIHKSPRRPFSASH